MSYRLTAEQPVEQYEDWEKRKTYTPYWAHERIPVFYCPHLDFVTSPQVLPRETWEIRWHRESKGNQSHVIAYVFSQDDAKFVTDAIRAALRVEGS